MEAFGSSAQKPSRRQPIYEAGGGDGQHQAPFSVNFYQEPPYLAEITLQDFEAYAMDRLKVLRVFENAAFRLTKGSPEYHDMILKDLTKEQRYRYVRSTGGAVNDEATLENQRLDVLSHFILRMVFSRNEVRNLLGGGNFHWFTIASVR